MKKMSAENTEAGFSEFSKNLAQATELWSEIASRMVAAKINDDHSFTVDPLNAQPTFTEIGKIWSENPQILSNTFQDYWEKQIAIFNHSVSRMLGSEDETTKSLSLPPEGKRFKHPLWSESPIYEYLKLSYLNSSSAYQGAVDNAARLMPARQGRKAAFFSRMIIEAMNPANFGSLNPEVIEATEKEKGANLVRGLQMMLEDLERGDGSLLVRQTDMSKFEVGRDIAITKGAVIFQNNIFQLIQYAPQTEQVYNRPLLIAPPWINKYYVLDLNPKKSLIEWLVKQGHTVFVMSWVNPDEKQKDEVWDSYITKGLFTAIDKVLEETGADKVHLAAYCVAGTLVASALAYMGKTNDNRVASATLLTAQADFENAGELQNFVDDNTLKVVDEQMEKGYLPAKAMAQAFNSLRSSDLIWSYVVSNYMLGQMPFPFDLLYWNADSTSMPARVHHFYLENFYNENNFAKNELEVLGEKVGPADIRVPIYHLATKEDHIAPAESVYKGAKMMANAEISYVLGGSGHIAGVVNPPDRGKYQYWSNPDLSADTLEEWLEQATETEGSWWLHWQPWLRRRSGKKVPGREPGAVNGIIEAAPGSYVKKRFDVKEE